MECLSLVLMSIFTTVAYFWIVIRPELQPTSDILEKVLIAIRKGVSLDTTTSLSRDYPPHAIRLSNRSISIIYFKTMRDDGKRAETIDLFLDSPFTSILITYVNGKMTRWSRNEMTNDMPEIDDQTATKATQILLLVRKEVAKT